MGCWMPGTMPGASLPAGRAARRWPRRRPLTVLLLLVWLHLMPTSVCDGSAAHACNPEQPYPYNSGLCACSPVVVAPAFLLSSGSFASVIGNYGIGDITANTVLSVDCSGRNLTAMPILPNTTVLADFSHNRIAVLEAPGGTAGGTDSLPPSLLFLFLRHNALTAIAAEALGAALLPDLQLLDLSFNSALGAVFAPPAGSAALTPTPALANLTPSLLGLDLAGCGLTAVPPFLGWSPTPSLVSLNVSYNAITALPAAGAPQLVVDTLASLTLDASHNRIAAIEPGFLRPLPMFNGSNSNFQTIITLDLGNNEIAELPSGTFSFALDTGTTLACTLDLSHNRITTIGAGTFSLNGLYFIVVNLANNAIADIAPGSLDAIDYYFDLSFAEGVGNPYLNQLGSGVSNIDLSSNRLTVIRSGMFGQMRVCTALTLRNNSLTQIEPGAFANTFLAAVTFGWTVSAEPYLLGSAYEFALDLSLNPLRILPESFFRSVPPVISIVLTHAGDPVMQLDSCCDASWLHAPTANVVSQQGLVTCYQPAEFSRNATAGYVSVDELDFPPCPCWLHNFTSPVNESGFCSGLAQLARLPGNQGCSGTGSCPPGLRFEPVDVDAGWTDCVSPSDYLPAGFVVRLRHMICRACNVPNCNNCRADIDQCLVCQPPYMELNGTCVTQCPPGYFVANNTPQGSTVEDLVCSVCPESSCFNCSANPRECQVCMNGTLLLAGSCLHVCPGGYGAVFGAETGLAASNGSCEQCLVLGCARCPDNLHACVECVGGLFLANKGTECVRTCPTGTTATAVPNNPAVCLPTPTTTEASGRSKSVVMGAVAGGLGAGVVAVVVIILVVRRHRRHTGEVETELTAKLLDSENRVERLRRVWEIDACDVSLQSRLAAGAQGEVWRGHFRGIEVGIKILHHIDLGDSLVSADFNAEVDALTQLRHRNLVLFYGAGTFGREDCGAEGAAGAHSPEHQRAMLPGARFLVVEYMARGALSTILAQSPTIALHTKLGFLRDSARGLQYIHRAQLIHRDVKTANLLVGSDWTVKVADLGTSRLHETLAGVERSGDGHGASRGGGAGGEDGSSEGAGRGRSRRWRRGGRVADGKGSQRRDRRDVALTAVHVSTGTEESGAGTSDNNVNDSSRSRDRFLTKGVGTPLYMAPEILQGRADYGREVDVFSYALCAWEVMEQQPPWAEIASGSFFMSRLLEAIESGRRPAIPDPPSGDDAAWPAPLRALVEQAWALDPAARPAFDDILAVLDESASWC